MPRQVEAERSTVPRAGSERGYKVFPMHGPLAATPAPGSPANSRRKRWPSKREITALTRTARKTMTAIESPDANRPAFARRVSCRTFSWCWLHGCRPLGTPAGARFMNSPSTN